MLKPFLLTCALALALPCLPSASAACGTDAPLVGSLHDCVDLAAAQADSTLDVAERAADRQVRLVFEAAEPARDFVDGAVDDAFAAVMDTGDEGVDGVEAYVHAWTGGVEAYAQGWVDYAQCQLLVESGTGDCSPP